MSEQSVMNAMLYASANASGFVNLSKVSLDSALRSAASVGYDEVTWTNIDPVQMPDTGAPPAAPEFSAITLTLPERPSPSPSLQSIPSISTGSMPVLSAVAPNLVFPSAPSGIDAAPEAPHIRTDFVFPEPPAALSDTLPPAPVFVEHAAPVAPQVVLPDFEDQLPKSVADAPTNATEIMRESYVAQLLTSQTNADAFVDAWLEKHSPEHHAQMARLESRLAEMVAGGTGFAVSVEDAIYSRARERNDVEAARVRDAAYSEAASRGFTLPTGVLFAGVNRARQEAANNNLKAAADIAIAQAELEQKNLQFAVTASAGLRTAMIGASLGYMGHVVSINSQAMDYAKSAVGAVVELFNSALRVYSTRIDAYKNYAAVHETRIKTALAKLDVYRAEIAALEALTNVDQSRAAIYKIQIDSLQALAATYRTRIEAVQGRASLEKLKIEIFQTQAQAFSASVSAKNAEWSGYNAAISGEEAKARIYGQQLSVFNSQLDAWKTTISAKIAEVDSVTRTNQANASMHQDEIRSYTALIGAESERARAENDNNRQQLLAFEKELAAFNSETQISLAKYSAESEFKLKNATGELSAQIEMARAKSQFGGTLAQLHAESAKSFAALAGSAMAGMSTLAADVNNT